MTPSDVIVYHCTLGTGRSSGLCYLESRPSREVSAMKKGFLFFLPLLIAAGLLLGLPKTATADDDPPGRVARLNYIQGAVSFQPGGEKDWVQANPNRPLTTGDNLWADQNSRGELHVGSTAIRLSSQTGISFLNLNDRTVQIQLSQGSMDVRLRHVGSGDAFEVDTPNLALSLLRPGEYRIDVDADGNTTVITVRGGEGEVTGGGNAYSINPGQRASFSGTDTLTYDETQAGPFDDFDEWCRSRDEREDRAPSARYVSRDVTGYEDLDDYGSWRPDPEYGTVWVPSGVPVGWAPYRFGHWVWIEPWGWTWVEDEPWGFAPFHYGRWVFVRGYWGWVPGPVVVRPVYAPALVAFVGGGGFSLSVFIGRGGGVAWFPLGPREVYVPGYRCSPRYVQNVNITNTTVNNTYVTNVYNNTKNVNVTKVTYVNQNAPGAVTAVSKETFVNARPVAASAVKVTPQQVQNAQVMRTAPVAPVRKSIVGSGAPATPTARPPAAAVNRKVVAKLSPPPPPVSYTRKQPILTAQPGRPPAPPQVEKLRKPQEQEHPSVRYAPPVRANEKMYGVHQGEKTEKNAPAPAQERGRAEGQGRPREPEPRQESRPAPKPSQEPRPAPKPPNDRP